MAGSVGLGAGAGDKLGTLPLSIPHRDVSSNFRFTAEAAKTAGMRQIEVPVTTLNEIVRTSDAPFPDLVKIDAEGFDLRVLAELPNWLAKPTSFSSKRRYGHVVSKTLWVM
jgi:FkbM family methyltransferase